MADLYFNDLEVAGEPSTLDAIAARVDADLLWAATETIADGERDGVSLRYRYDTKCLRRSAAGIAAISYAFPDLTFLLRFENPNLDCGGSMHFRGGGTVLSTADEWK